MDYPTRRQWALAQSYERVGLKPVGPKTNSYGTPSYSLSHVENHFIFKFVERLDLPLALASGLPTRRQRALAQFYERVGLKPVGPKTNCHQLKLVAILTELQATLSATLRIILFSSSSSAWTYH